MDVLHIIVDYTLNLKSTSASIFVKTYSFNDGFGWRFSWKHIWIHLVNPVIGGPSGHVSVLSPSGMVCWQLDLRCKAGWLFCMGDSTTQLCGNYGNNKATHQDPGSG